MTASMLNVQACTGVLLHKRVVEVQHVSLDMKP